MTLPEYVSKDEVRKVSEQLGIRDWSKLTEPEVSEEEASKILKAIDAREMDIPLEDFRRGLEVELEHGTMFADANVTNNHPVLTGKIVLAHLKETMDYYKRLEVVELEGDLLKAVASKNMAKIESKFKKLVQAREELARAEREALK
ncbi:MAG: hypothetical protein IBX68_12075 [Dehalococcoidia bacterium]|nr:hypothetical protein [Dehalococcoidia bacterium]